MSNLGHPENNINDGFWRLGSPRGNQVEPGVPVPAATWQNTCDVMSSDKRIADLHGLLVSRSPELQPLKRPVQVADEAPADFVGEAYTPEERPHSRSWLKKVATIGLVVAPTVAVALFGKAYIDHENLMDKQKKAAVSEALRDPDTLGALGVCAIELRTEADFLRDSSDRTLDRHYPSAKEYDKGAEMAASWNVPCDSQVRQAASQINDSNEKQIELSARDVVHFNLADACNGLNYYSFAVRRNEQTEHLAEGYATMVNRAGIEC